MKKSDLIKDAIIAVTVTAIVFLCAMPILEKTYKPAPLPDLTQEVTVNLLK